MKIQTHNIKTQWGICCVYKPSNRRRAHVTAPSSTPTRRVWNGSLTRFQNETTPNRAIPEKYGCDLSIREGTLKGICEVR